MTGARQQHSKLYTKSLLCARVSAIHGRLHRLRGIRYGNGHEVQLPGHELHRSTDGTSSDLAAGVAPSSTITWRIVNCELQMQAADVKLTSGELFGQSLRALAFRGCPIDAAPICMHYPQFTLSGVRNHGAGFT